MKIIVCADIHGNYQALQSLLKTKCAKSADKIYVLGDLVCMGPEPNEVIEAIKNNPKIIPIMGNHDKWVAIEPPPSSKNAKRIKIKHHEYMKAMITDENLDYLKHLPYYIEINYGNTKFYLTHYGWKDNFCEVIEHTEIVENKYNIKEVFGDIKADCVIFGHNHDPLEFECDKIKYICAGTLGMSKYGTYLVITFNEDGSYIIERKSLHIQVYKTLKKMRQLKYPRYNLYSSYLLGKYASIYQAENVEENPLNEKPVKLLFKSTKNNNFKKSKDRLQENEKKLHNFKKNK